MTIETITGINTLDPTYPTAGDAKSEGDDHIRGVKSAIRWTFTGFTGVQITVTEADINTVTARGLRAGDTWTGTHSFTGATLNVATQALGDSSNAAASTAFVAAQAFSSALPAINSGTKGMAVTNDGSTGSWGYPWLSTRSLFYASI